MLIHELLLGFGGLLLIIFALVIKVPIHHANPFDSAYRER
jgi:hypothetical protein